MCTGQKKSSKALRLSLQHSKRSKHIRTYRTPKNRISTELHKSKQCKGSKSLFLKLRANSIKLRNKTRVFEIIIVVFTLRRRPQTPLYKINLQTSLERVEEDFRNESVKFSSGVNKGHFILVKSENFSKSYFLHLNFYIQET